MGMSVQAVAGNHVVLGFRLSEIYCSVSFSAPSIGPKNRFFFYECSKVATVPGNIFA